MNAFVDAATASMIVILINCQDYEQAITNFSTAS